MTWLVLLVVVVAVALAATWPIRAHNALVRMQTVVIESWRGIDIELARRWDLIPRLVDVARAFAKHEAATLIELARVRSPGGLSEDPTAALAQLNDGVLAATASQDLALDRAIRRLRATAEGYPELRASDHYSAVLSELAATDDRIAAARRLYNGNVSRYNARLRSFPVSAIGRRTGFDGAEFFELDDPAKARLPPLRGDPPP
ncbi:MULTISPECIES: LemA family protein [Gordonia]|uniref:LemA family protein n=1 Tax=Gordonia TaxID=2053 RepID=UPI0025C3FD79|nr:LemA family protein [Gordonia sp. UBA5067]